MARGMVVGEAIVSQANTQEYNDGYERTFGDRKPVRGRWIYDARLGKCVPADEYQPESRALDAPIITDRWYEGQAALDGTDIGSRAKREAYMKAKGLVDANDFSQSYFDRQRAEKARADAKERRADVIETYRRHKATTSIERLAPRGQSHISGWDD